MVLCCRLEGQEVLLLATSRPHLRFSFCLFARLSLAILDLIPLRGALRGFMMRGLLLSELVGLVFVRKVIPLSLE